MSESSLLSVEDVDLADDSLQDVIREAETLMRDLPLPENNTTTSSGATGSDDAVVDVNITPAPALSPAPASAPASSAPASAPAPALSPAARRRWRSVVGWLHRAEAVAADDGRDKPMGLHVLELEEPDVDQIQDHEQDGDQHCMNRRSHQALLNALLCQCKADGSGRGKQRRTTARFCTRWLLNALQAFAQCAQGGWDI